MAILRFNQVSLAYGAQSIFKHFTACIDRGEFIAVLGANGAGKSTLLRAVLGLISPIQGQILFDNCPLKKGNSAIGYMPQVRQQPLIDSRLSAYAWLGANLDGYRWGIPAFKTEQKNELERVIHLVKAKDIIHKSFSLLSGGERQRLLLAQALLNRPKILLLDEPLMNLDPYYQATLVDLINTIRLKCRVAVLFTSHDINPLLRCVSRVIYLAQGKAAIGLVDEVINSKQLSALYGMDIQVIQYEEQLFVINKELGFHSHADHCTPDTHRHPI